MDVPDSPPTLSHASASTPEAASLDLPGPQARGRKAPRSSLYAEPGQIHTQPVVATRPRTATAPSRDNH
ncbi:MAG: hypothetical protein QOD93_1836 [Acetobacteraceae bacterium]|jgi:hypothetical protein|nr:hypothetical protein [Acetobacteraceae bacterium]